MTEDLFSEQRADKRNAAAPLAARMRPRRLEEIVGQRHLLEPGAAFRSVIESGRLVSMILWGPPGTGKTTLARVVAAENGARFEQLSAVSAGVRDVRAILADARARIEEDRGRTILFLDEIHRFNKAQQDALLPGVEDGTVILVGATTENPFFEVNSPLISRSTVFRTEPLSTDEIADVLRRAHQDEMRGLGGDPPLEDEAVAELAERVGGDARLALNALEVAASISLGAGEPSIGVAAVAESLQRRIIRYDKAGDRHYDVVSAFIKSMRGSDPDAALYWLHTMLQAGEDPEFIARRMIILASEDVGLADSDALAVAVSAFDALRVVGLPEAEYALTHAALYLALAPKSNSIAEAMSAAKAAVEATPAAQVPPHLRSAVHAGQKALGDAVGYVYPHDRPGAVVEQQYLPDEARGLIVYRPKDQGDEAALAGSLRDIDSIANKPPRDRPD
ncbi:MAG TPA: replication-associated recombination protein A [Acidimicrobiia bacterium]|jgi:putative ATPase